MHQLFTFRTIYSKDCPDLDLVAWPGPQPSIAELSSDKGTIYFHAGGIEIFLKCKDGSAEHFQLKQKFKLYGDAWREYLSRIQWSFEHYPDELLDGSVVVRWEGFVNLGIV